MGLRAKPLDTRRIRRYTPAHPEVVMSRLALLIVLAGCSQTYSTEGKSPIGSDTADTGSGNDTDTDSGTDTAKDTGKDTGVDTGKDSGIDTADTATDTGGDTGTDTGTAGSCPASKSQMVWVVQTLEVAETRGGLDLDGDGTGDNVLAAVRDALNTSIIDTFPTTPVVLAWQMWGVDDWCDDPSITGAFLSPSDVDGDHTDDYSGTEAFSAGAQINGKGLAVENGAGSITSGTYTFSFASGSFDVGGFTLVNATPVLVTGTADESGNSGKFAFGMDKSLMAEIAVAEGYDASLADALADLDTDGDGVGDALSVTFDFVAVPATVY